MAEAACATWLEDYGCDGLRFDSANDLPRDAVQVGQRSTVVPRATCTWAAGTWQRGTWAGHLHAPHRSSCH